MVTCEQSVVYKCQYLEILASMNCYYLGRLAPC